MRVLQLIDSLHPGGAERVSVNIANALVRDIDKSFICCTREEGILKSEIDSEVGYLFLNKKRTLDITAIFRLSKFIKKNRINIIHAHSTSFFLAVLIRIFIRDIKLVWHDHYGNSEYLKERKSFVLKRSAKYFDYVFCVNRNLEKWARETINLKNVKYLPNFAHFDTVKPQTKLLGVKGKRIICLANLRPQKDHLTLIKSFKLILKNHPEWTLHLVGKDFKDDYSRRVKNEIKKNNLSKSVIIYGSKPDIMNILSQCEIGLLSSKSEGLPIALLEYGLAKLAVISTDVGECKTVIETEDNGILVKPNDVKNLYEAIKYFVDHEKDRIQKSKSFNLKVTKKYSQKVGIKTILNTYNKI